MKIQISPGARQLAAVQWLPLTDQQQVARSFWTPATESTVSKHVINLTHAVVYLVLGVFACMKAHVQCLVRVISVGDGKQHHIALCFSHFKLCQSVR